MSFSNTLMINEEKTKEIITEEVWICDLNYHKIAPEISDKMHHKTLKRVLMGVPNYQLTTNFSANCQLTTIFLANCQLTTNFSYLLTFIISQR